MKPLRVCIVEDSDQDAADLTCALERFTHETGIPFTIERLRDGGELTGRNARETEVFFLDIEMPGVDGMSLAHQLRQHESEAVIVFITHAVSHVLEGYTVDASAYLIKPLNYEQLKAHLRRIFDKFERHQSRLVSLKSGREDVFLNINHILYVETQNKRALVHTKNGTVLCSESLQSVIKKLGDDQFFRIHNAYVINLAYVDAVTSKEAIVSGEALPISKHRKRFFMQALAEYKGRSL